VEVLLLCARAIPLLSDAASAGSADPRASDAGSTQARSTNTRSTDLRTAYAHPEADARDADALDADASFITHAGYQANACSADSGSADPRAHTANL
jgi:hypothetical protein